MMNRNVADYTNFGGGKTNNRVLQAPGGSSSLSLGWGDTGQEPQRRGYDRQKAPQQSYQYNNQPKYDNRGTDNGYNERNNNWNMPEEQPTYGRKNNYGGNQQQIGGQHGYSNYNPITHASSSTKMNYQQAEQSYGNQYAQQNRYAPIMEPDPQSFYKPSSSSYKNFSRDQLDRALEQQKTQVQSSRGQRSNQQKTSINQNYQQQSSNDTKPCVKIHQQRNNDIFGNEYDYWKQDGHNTSNQKNVQKQKPYYHERVNNIQGYSAEYTYAQNPKNEKTSVKVHNPPGGRTNFTFG